MLPLQGAWVQSLVRELRSHVLCSAAKKCWLLSCVWLFVTPWTVSCQAPLSTGFSRQGYWSGLPWPPLGYLPDPAIELVSLTSPALAGGFFTTSTTWEAQLSLFHIKIMCSSNEEVLMIKIKCKRKNFTFIFTSWSSSGLKRRLCTYRRKICQYVNSNYYRV